MAYKPQTLTVSDGGTGSKTLTGVLTGNGTGAVTASTVTEYGVLVGGASNAVSSTAVGTAGEVLTSNGPGLAPTFQAGGGGGGISTINGDSGSATGSTVTFNANSQAGSTVTFSGASSTVSLNISNGTNTIVGSGAGNSTLTGAQNVGFGGGVLAALTDGSLNTSVGYFSLNDVTSGTSNTGIGLGALGSITTGQTNTALGWAAGSNYTTEVGNISIGHIGTAAESNTIRIGTQGSGTDQQNKCFIAGITGVTTSNTNYVTVNTSTGQLGATAAVGKLVLISSQNASNSATIDFTGLTYNTILVVYTSVQPVTNAQDLQMLVSNNNGSSYSATGYLSGINYSAYNSSTLANSNTTTEIKLSVSQTNVTNTQGSVYLFNTNVGSNLFAQGDCSFTNGTGSFFGQVMANGGITGVNAIRFKYASGNINVGTFTLYGFARS